MNRTNGERAIRSWAGAAAAAVAGFFVAGAGVTQAAAPEGPQQTTRERLQIALQQQRGDDDLPTGAVRRANGDAVVLAASVYAGEVTDVLDGETVVVRRGADGVLRRVKLFGVKAPAAGTPLGRQAREELRRSLKGQTVQVHHRTATAATVYLVPESAARSGGGAAAAAGATTTGEARPPVALRPYTGGVDASGTARDLSIGAPSTTAGTTATTVSQSARPLAIPGGLRLTLNEGVLRSGFARWDTSEAADDSGLKGAEAEARKARRGIWADALER